MEPGWKKLALGVYELGLPAKSIQKDLLKIAGNLVPLNEFTTKQIPLTDEAYAQAYALMHYLFNAESGKYRTGLCRLLKIAEEGRGDENTFEKEIGVKPSELDNKFRDYCSKVLK
jgi:hypothetical protein